MPKRLSDFSKTGEFTLHIGGVAKTGPIPALLAGRLVAMMSWIAHSRTMIATLVMKADHMTVSAMMGAIRSPGVLRTAVTAAVQASRSAEEAALCGRVLALVEPLERIRNSFAHSLWIGCSDLKDHLIVLDPKHLSAVGALRETWAHVASKATETTDAEGKETTWTFPEGGLPLHPEILNALPANALVYEVDELRALVVDALNAYEALELFQWLVRKEGEPDKARSRLDELLRGAGEWRKTGDEILRGEATPPGAGGPEAKS